MGYTIDCKGCKTPFTTYSALVRYCAICSAKPPTERPRDDKVSRRQEERRNKRKGG